MNKQSVIVLSILLLVTPALWGQQPRARSKAELPASSAEPKQPLTAFDLDFPGGIPQELVKAIEISSAKPLNAKEETAPGEFRAAVLEQILHQARCRSRGRHRNRQWAALALLAAVLLPLGMVFFPSVFRKEGRQPRITLVRSQPLKTSLIVESKPGVAKVVVSRLANIILIESQPAPGTWKEIDDETLLTLLTGHPAVLVKRGPQNKELIFLEMPGPENVPVN